MRMEFTMDNVAKWLKESTDWLIDNQQGCCTLKLDDHLAICVGWSAGYGDEERDDVIQAKDDRDYAINAGIKVWTSDDLRTDSSISRTKKMETFMTTRFRYRKMKISIGSQMFS